MCANNKHTTQQWTNNCMPRMLHCEMLGCQHPVKHSPALICWCWCWCWCWSSLDHCSDGWCGANANACWCQCASKSIANNNTARMRLPTLAPTQHFQSPLCSRLWTMHLMSPHKNAGTLPVFVTGSWQCQCQPVVSLLLQVETAF